MPKRITNRMVIETARALIARPENWTSEAMARDGRGEIVEVLSDDTVRFCAIGALHRAAFDLIGQGPFQHRWDRAMRVLGSSSLLVRINDGIGREAVLEVFDKWLKKNPARRAGRKQKIDSRDRVDRETEFASSALCTKDAYGRERADDLHASSIIGTCYIWRG